MDQVTLNIVFVIVAVIVVVIFLAVRRYWESRLNMSEADEELERRVSSLNETQANRRRDDEIVRLLRGDEQPTVSQRDRRDEG
jgi:FtsZ-interacting cell division protein ZipA